MKVLLSAVCLALIVVTGPTAVRAEVPAEVKAVLDKAIKATGGAEAIGKQKAIISKMKGKFHGLGEAMDYTGGFMSQAPDRFRFEVSMQVMGQTFTFIQAVKGNKGWESQNGMVVDMPKEHVEEAHHSLHLGEVTRLLVLKGKDYKLSSLGDAKVDKRSAVGIHVERAGKRDINLFFDKENGLLVKSETRVKDTMGGDQEYTQATIYRDYKKVDGIMVAHKVEISRDDKLFVEGEITEIQHAEKLDDAQLAKP